MIWLAVAGAILFGAVVFIFSLIGLALLLAAYDMFK
jgi:hypothetical protein